MLSASATWYLVNQASNTYAMFRADVQASLHVYQSIEECAKIVQLYDSAKPLNQEEVRIQDRCARVSAAFQWMNVLRFWVVSTYHHHHPICCIVTVRVTHDMPSRG